ncbi:hypothetical protein PK98_08475 [Croceibacterium mercuriale]|uniref:Uncharacterized protein n=1 Tax=Croceibacterium mercuriale TaxID=1572751 RepID=A0A0B2C2P9_9SPHN|nr:hypothetical protein PK98_08475 [Croceibacterium mercuriale]
MPDSTIAPQPGPAAATPPPATPEDEGGVTWLGWAAVAGLLAGGAVLLVLRRRRTAEPEQAAPVPPTPLPVPVRTPVPPPAPRIVPTSAAHPAAGLAEVELHIVAERLSLSLMNATLTFQLTLRHAGATPLTGVTLHGDLIAAHGALSQEEQLGGPAADAPMIARLPDLSEEARTIRGEVRLPLAQVNAIRQGRSNLLVPLLRLALETEGQGRRTLTALVGPPGQGGQVQPVLLDAGPRVITPLLARVLG